MNFESKLPDQIKNALVKSNATLAVAESVTAGHIQAALSIARDARLFFQGGITVYNIGQKCRHLHIEPTHAIENDCVSKTVSQQMAKEVCNLFASDYGIAITGYASIVPGSGMNKLFAFIAVAKKDKILLTKKITTKSHSPSAAQMDYTTQALKLFLTAIKK